MSVSLKTIYMEISKVFFWKKSKETKVEERDGGEVQ
jgi:hypothetical protein